MNFGEAKKIRTIAKKIACLALIVTMLTSSFITPTMAFVNQTNKLTENITVEENTEEESPEEESTEEEKSTTLIEESDKDASTLNGQKDDISNTSSEKIKDIGTNDIEANSNTTIQERSIIQEATTYFWVCINNEWKKLYNNEGVINLYAEEDHDEGNWYGNKVNIIKNDDGNYYITSDTLEIFYKKFGYNKDSSWNFAYSEDSYHDGNLLDFNCEPSTVNGKKCYKISGIGVENIYLLPNTTNIQYGKDRSEYTSSDTLYTVTKHDGDNTTTEYFQSGNNVSIELRELDDSVEWLVEDSRGNISKCSESSFNITGIDRSYNISNNTNNIKLWPWVITSNGSKIILDEDGRELKGYQSALSANYTFYVPISEIFKYYEEYGLYFNEDETYSFSYAPDANYPDNTKQSNIVTINGVEHVKVRDSDAYYEESEFSPRCNFYYNSNLGIVLFDGTNGNQNIYSNAGKKEVLIQSNSDSSNKVDVKIPDISEINVPNVGYKWKLAGWYDIINKKYYDSSYFGKDVSTTPNAIFYADWIAESYDNGKSEATKKGEDTSEFIKTNIYDYNDLFNALDSEYDSNSQSWRLKDSDDGFVFHDALAMKYGQLGNPDGKGIISAWSGSEEPTKGILSKRKDILNKLFDKTGSTLGVHYLGMGNELYYLNDNGYYEYDSTKAAASYNQSKNSIGLYNETQNIINIYGETYEKQFLLLNGEEENYNGNNYSINYWFGLESEISFFLPSDTGKGLNTINGKEMHFYFSGDDDVWIFVDDKLVLDIGGIHDACSAEINFSTGECYVNEERQDDLSLKAGEHTLKMYYLERGAAQSNLKVSFLVAPAPTITVKKVDKENKSKVLKNAEFSLQNEYGKYYVEHEKVAHWSDSKVTIETDEQGLAKFIGLVDGTYTLKEENAPVGYNRIPIEAKIVVKNGVIISISSEGIDDISGLYTTEGNATLVAYNEKSRIPITAKKIWCDDNNKAGKRPDSVTLQIKDGDKVVEEAQVNEENNWEYTFEVPEYDELGNKINYTIDEKENYEYYNKVIEGETVINICTYEEPKDPTDLDEKNPSEDTQNPDEKNPLKDPTDTDEKDTSKDYVDEGKKEILDVTKNPNITQVKTGDEGIIIYIIRIVVAIGIIITIKIGKIFNIKGKH